MNKFGFLAIVYIGLIIIITLLVKVLFLVNAHYEAFEENPLLFGAGKYNIDMCSCFTDEGKTFIFNQTTIYREATAKRDFNLTLNITFMRNGTI